MVGIESIEGMHEPGLPRLVARVEEVPPVIRGRREVHQHHAALLVVEAGPVDAIQELHGGANEVGRVVGGIRQAYGGALAIEPAGWSKTDWS
jgi:hypothetical protein